MAYGTFFNITPRNVKFSFEDSAVMAWLVSRVPIVGFASVLNPFDFVPAY